MLNFDQLRLAMVEQQLKSRDIRDERIIAVFSTVPRHEFVEEKFQPSAYEDHPLPIGANQTISQPYMVALMVQCLGLKGGEKVLEIGTGSGYQTAILAKLACEVYSVERIQDLADKAKANLAKLGYKNIKIKCEDGTLGWKEYAPFDGIIVSAAAPVIPQELVSQLKENARLVIPVGGAFSQTLTIIKKEKENLAKEEVCGCVFVPLIGKEGWQNNNAK